jgi:hypothetical protein
MQWLEVGLGHIPVAFAWTQLKVIGMNTYTGSQISSEVFDM